MAGLLPRRRAPREFKARNNYLASLRDGEIISQYRLNRDCIQRLVDLINDDVGPKTNRSQAISTTIKLLVTLNFLARGEFYFEDGLTHGISKSSVCRSIWQVVEAVNRRIENIKFPVTDVDRIATKHSFFQISRIPNCLGAIDGTLIPIIAPSRNEQAYVCRKGYHAINVQAIVDANMRFTDIVARWPGSTHDSTIFQNCSIQTYLEENDYGWLIGDSGYPLRPYLMTPKLNPITQQEERFNRALSRTRMVVERAFGMLKSRFRCLHKTGGSLQVHPEKAAQLFTVCAKLHNICIDNNIMLEGDDVQPEGNDYPENFPVNNNCAVIRQNIINRF